jgi:hypothetical protein
MKTEGKLQSIYQAYCSYFRALRVYCESVMQVCIRLWFAVKLGLLQLRRYRTLLAKGAVLAAHSPCEVSQSSNCCYLWYTIVTSATDPLR